MAARVIIDGKFFSLGDERFRFSGVTYGTFQPRADGLSFPEPAVIRDDFDRISESGFTVVRTYTPPPDDLLEAAEDADLHVLTDVFYQDWRYLVGFSRRDHREVVKTARRRVQETAARFVGHDRVLGLSVGNEIPADVVRWVGTRRVADALASLVEAVKEIDPTQLVTYANYPTAEFLPLDQLDFLTFNVFLESTVEFRRYLMRLHHLAGNRPLVVGEMGLDAGSDDEEGVRQSRVLGSQLLAARELGVAGTTVFSWTDDWWVAGSPVEDWHFGLTRVDRSPRSSMAVARARNESTLVEIRDSWPRISVVICAYNESATIGECLSQTTSLDYPELEIIVVDDGSTDDTAEVVAGFPQVRLLRIDHSGLAVARNEGLRKARGEIVAYLDADAYPCPEWPFFLALGFENADVVGVGGPNIPPRNDPPMAQLIALGPGGPTHVLLSDDRAEHIPGCNMAFRKSSLEEVSGFDPIFERAGDDVDICWRLLDSGGELGFHPGAFVWHHPRSTIRRYWGQQAGYGRAEAAVAARHPNRYTPSGQARWRGRIYHPSRVRRDGQTIYRGPFASGLFQSVYRQGPSPVDTVAPPIVLLATAFLLFAPLSIVDPRLAVSPLIGAAALVTIFMCAAARYRSHLVPGIRRSVVAVTVGFVHLIQPLARLLGRLRGGGLRRDMESAQLIRGPVHRVGRGVWLLPADQPRPEVAKRLVAALRRSGIRVSPQTGWDAHDGRLIGSTLIVGELVTTAYPHGWIQILVRRRFRVASLILATATTLAAGALNPSYAVPFLGLGLVEVARGLWRTRVSVGSVFETVASSGP